MCSRVSYFLRFPTPTSKPSRLWHPITTPRPIQLRITTHTCKFFDSDSRLKKKYGSTRLHSGLWTNRLQLQLQTWKNMTLSDSFFTIIFLLRIIRWRNLCFYDTCFNIWTELRHTLKSGLYLCEKERELYKLMFEFGVWVSFWFRLRLPTLIDIGSWHRLPNLVDSDFSLIRRWLHSSEKFSSDSDFQLQLWPQNLLDSDSKNETNYYIPFRLRIPNVKIAK